ncbi:MAG: polyprenol phosphomannose-dependent alpha 1,6 mannosyltransferase MptB [Propionibacteriaceae bacterium]|nr:polyprenol phosphomannose-dependent alpha 1,6 mannosyltransferase MptB [Propionibacteriaceae bacterium]
MKAGHVATVQALTRWPPFAALRRIPAGAWVGFAGSCLVALAQLMRLAQYPQIDTEELDPTILRAFLSDRSIGTLTAFGVLLLIGAWIMIRPEFTRAKPRAFMVAGFWLIPLLPILGVLSDDYNIYAEFGWDQLQGMDPYNTGIAETGSPFPTNGVWNGMTAAYPPLALRLFAIIVMLAGSHWYWSVVGLRLLALLGVGLLAWGLVKVAPVVGVDWRFALWLGVFNPVVIVHGVGGMHVDMLMAGMTVAALAVAVTKPGWRGLIWGSMLVGLAAGVKQHALLAVVPVAMLALPAVPVTMLALPDRPQPGRRPPAEAVAAWWRIISRITLAGLIGLGTFLALGLVTRLGHGWVKELDTPARYDTPGPATLISHAIGSVYAALDRPTPEGTTELVRQIILGLVVFGLLVLFFRYARTNPIQFLAAGALLAAFGLSGTREWYLILWLAVLPLANPGRWMRGAASLLAPFMALTAAFHSYQYWWVLESVHVAAGIAIALNAGGWIVPRRPFGQLPATAEAESSVELVVESPVALEIGSPVEPTDVPSRETETAPEVVSVSQTVLDPEPVLTSQTQIVPEVEPTAALFGRADSAEDVNWRL